MQNSQQKHSWNLSEQNKDKFVCKVEFAVWKFISQDFEPLLSPITRFYMNPFYGHVWSSFNWK